MSEIPEISLVVPVFNEEGTLGALLDGIRLQRMLPAEIIIVDSGSTDDSLGIVQRWARAFMPESIAVRMIDNPGGMPGANRNRGIAAANCRWVAFLDAGVVPDVDWLQRLWNCTRVNHSLSAIGYARFQADGAFPSAVCALSYGMGARLPVLPGSLFHCSVFDEVGLFREDIRAAEDLLWRRALKDRYGKEVLCEKAHVQYSHFPTTISAVVKKWWVYEKHTCLAGIGIGSKHLLIGIALCVVIFVVLLPLPGGMAFCVYALYRGIVEPMRRSGWMRWWQGNIWAALMAVPIAIIIDLVKIISWVVALYFDIPYSSKRGGDA